MLTDWFQVSKQPSLTSSFNSNLKPFNQETGDRAATVLTERDIQQDEGHSAAASHVGR